MFFKLIFLPNCYFFVYLVEILKTEPID